MNEDIKDQNCLTSSNTGIMGVRFYNPTYTGTIKKKCLECGEEIIGKFEKASIHPWPPLPFICKACGLVSEYSAEYLKTVLVESTDNGI